MPSSILSKDGKEIAIRFALSSGLSSARTMIVPKAVINDSDYPKLDDLLLNLKNSDHSLTVKNLSILAGLSYITNKTKTGTNTNPDDLANVINAFATDFEDGVFDGNGSKPNHTCRHTSHYNTSSCHC